MVSLVYLLNMTAIYVFERLECKDAGLNWSTSVSGKTKRDESRPFKSFELISRGLANYSFSP
jgi:hypothetical protein